MLLKVAHDDVISYKNNNAWPEHHPAKSMMFAQIEKIWDSLNRVYNFDFKSLVFGELPTDEQILGTL